jgi:cobalt-zinc-cadmium efflux system outer membrane protein
MRLSLLGLLLAVAASQAMAESGSRPIRLPPTAVARRLIARPRRQVEPGAAALRLVDQIELLPAEPLEGQPEGIAAPAGSVLLTLNAAIETALQGNPALITLRQNVPVRRAALALAGTYPHDPSVQTTVLPSTRLPGGGYGSTVISVQALETLEIAHQPRWRWQAGSAELSQTEWRIAEAELRSVAATTRRYFAVLYRRELHCLTARLAELNEELLGVLQRRFQAGQATASDVALGAIEARAARQQAALAAAALRAAELDLQVYLGVPAGSRFVVAGDIRNWSWRSADEVVATGVERGPLDTGAAAIRSDWAVKVMANRRPDVAAARANLALAMAQCRLAHANRIPNIDVGPSYEQDEDSTEFWGVVTQMTLPTFGSRRAVVRQRSAEVQQSQVALRQLRRQFLPMR